MLAFYRVGGDPDFNRTQGVFDIVQMPVGTVRWLQMMGQSSAQAAGAESAAHIDPVSAGQKNRSYFSGDRLKGCRTAENQGIGALAVNGHFKCFIGPHLNGGSPFDVPGNLQPASEMRHKNGVCLIWSPVSEMISLYFLLAVYEGFPDF